VRKNQTIVLVSAVGSIILLLVVAAFLLINSNSSSSSNGMMGESGGATNTNNSVVAIVLIAMAIILSVVIALYFSVYSRSEKNEMVTESSLAEKLENERTSCRVQELGPRLEADSRPFDVFLCYKKSSGKDFADHLKSGLEELGFHTFEDCKDIPRTVDTEEGWAFVRDKALEQSRYFVLIMTPGFELSSEVVKEIGVARKQPNKTFVFFRLRNMKRNIVVNLGDEKFDIGKLEQVSFDSKEELLRLANDILLKHR